MLHVLAYAQMSDETQHKYMNSSQGILSLTKRHLPPKLKLNFDFTSSFKPCTRTHLNVMTSLQHEISLVCHCYEKNSQLKPWLLQLSPISSPQTAVPLLPALIQAVSQPLPSTYLF